MAPWAKKSLPHRTDTGDVPSRFRPIANWTGGNWDGYLKLFTKAQRKVESRHYTSRVDLMVHEKQRQEILKDLGADPFVD